MVTDKNNDDARIVHAIETAKLQIQEGQLRLEEARLRLENELHYLERWKVDITPVEQVAIEAGKGAISFALTAIKTGLLLNGGALVALPAFAQIFTISAELLKGPVNSFVLGLLLCGVASIFGYIAMTNAEGLHSCIRQLRVIKLNLEHNPNLDKSDLNLRREELARQESTYKMRARNFRNAGLALIVFGYTAFCVGGFLGVDVFTHKPPSQKSNQPLDKK